MIPDKSLEPPEPTRFELEDSLDQLDSAIERANNCEEDIHAMRKLLPSEHHAHLAVAHQHIAELLENLYAERYDVLLDTQRAV